MEQSIYFVSKANVLVFWNEVSPMRYFVINAQKITPLNAKREHEFVADHIK